MDNPWLKQGTPWENTLHCWILVRIMRWWVAGAAVFLVLFGTAAVLPETLEPGSAALVVPAARRRSLILAGRFAGSLGYLIFQTTLVIAGLWLVVWYKLGIWHHSLWLGVPLAALLFAPLQAVAMLLGVLTRSGTAALLVAILFSGTVWALQVAAAGPPKKEPPAAGSAAGEDDDNAGISDAIGGEAARGAALVLPNPMQSLEWLEERACPKPALAYRELFRRLRIGHSGLSAAAAAAIAESSTSSAVESRNDRLDFAALLLSSAGFSAIVLAGAGWLLKRRDL